MARQIGFFWDGSDEVEFLDFLRSNSDLRLLGYTSPTEDFEPLADLPGREDPAWFHVWLRDAARCQSPFVHWVEQQQHYTIDRFASEVIELSRSYERNGVLIRGRLWAEFSGWHQDAPEHTFEKTESFREWYKMIEAWMRRHYSRLSTGDLIAPGAHEFTASGGRLAGVPLADVVKLVRHP